MKGKGEGNGRGGAGRRPGKKKTIQTHSKF